MPDDVDLALADADTLAAMARLYTAVKATLGRDPWVTASKVCARKRPRLYPVRDRRVRTLIGVYELGDYSIDWQVFAALMRDVEISERLTDVAEHAPTVRPGGTVQLDPYPLRHLDVLMWMDARARGIGGPQR